MSREKYRIVYANSSTAMNDVRYVSGFVAPDPVLLIMGTKKHYLVVSSMEVGRAQRECYSNVEVLTPEGLLLPAKQRWKVASHVQAIAKRDRIESFEVGADFPVGIVEDLKRRKIRVVLSREATCPERRIKREAEIKQIAYTQRAAVAGMRRALELLETASIDSGGTLRLEGRPLTAERVKEAIQMELLKWGCSGQELIVAGGEQAVDPHERGSGALRAHEAIILDIFPRHEQSGYWGDITRTVCRGEAPTRLKNLYQTVLKAQKEALASVRAGICGDEIHSRIVERFGQAGFVTGEVEGKQVGFIHGTGHGVGLDIHEGPRIGRSGEVLRQGDVVTVEPGLYYPGLGGVRIEDTVAVEKDGFRWLARCAKKFELRKQ